MSLNSHSNHNYNRGETAVYDDVKTFEHLTMNFHHNPSSIKPTSLTTSSSHQQQQHLHHNGNGTATTSGGAAAGSNMSIAAHRNFLSKIRKSNKLTSIATSIAKQRGLNDPNTIISNPEADTNASANIDRNQPFGFDPFNDNAFLNGGGTIGGAGAAGSASGTRDEEKKTNDGFGSIENHNHQRTPTSSGSQAVAAAQKRLLKHKQHRQQKQQQQQQQLQQQQQQQQRGAGRHHSQQEAIAIEKEQFTDTNQATSSDLWSFPTNNKDSKTRKQKTNNDDWGFQPGGDPFGLNTSLESHSDHDGGGGGKNMEFSAIHMFNDDDPFSIPFVGSGSGGDTLNNAKDTTTKNSFTTSMMTHDNMFNDTFENAFIGTTKVKTTKVKSKNEFSKRDGDVVEQHAKRKHQLQKPPQQQKLEKQLPPIAVVASIHEQLSIIVDDVSSTPSTTVTGSIRVKPIITKSLSPSSNHFCLTLRDEEGNIEHCEAGLERGGGFEEGKSSKNGNGSGNGGPCENITATLPHLALHNNDQVFRISLRKNHQETLEAPIASYTCVPRLRPMPLVRNEELALLFACFGQEHFQWLTIVCCMCFRFVLCVFRVLLCFSYAFQMLRSRVRTTDLICRVAIRVRANPGNPIILSNSALVMVVPPDVVGENVAMSREGGVWNSMTRLLSWQLGDLQPGQTIAIETRFDRLASTNNSSSVPKFPILIRCDGGAIFSGIELKTEYADNNSQPANVKTMESSRILYRKV